ncbi:MAG: LysR family transcriptional regulator [Neobacillus sp.]
MDIRQLRYFIAVAEHLNFTEAANHLFIAQSSLSQRIAELEKSLGVKLFKRNKRFVQLTSAGTVFLQEATDILQKYAEATERTRRADSGILGTLNIGFLGHSVNQFLPKLVKNFHVNYPHITLKFDRYSHGRLNESLKNEELDIAFTSSFGLQNIPNLDLLKVYRDQSCVVVHQDHPLATRTKIMMTELTEESFITLKRQVSPQAYDRFLKMCNDSGFSPSIVNQTSFLDTVLLLVEAGMGIAVMPKSVKTIANPGLFFLEIDGSVSQFDMVAAWKKSNPNPSIPFFLKEIENFVSEYSENNALHIMKI